jgi:antirestriction protein ArdC
MSHKAQEQQVEAILEQLAKGVAPWARPWQSLGAQRNAKTGRLYHGVNALYLSAISSKESYGAPLWVTAKQAKELGGHIKGKVTKFGEVTQEDQWDKFCLVVWWRPSEKNKVDENGQPVLNEDGEPEVSTRWFSGCQRVYNVEQTTIPKAKYQKYLPETYEHEERNEKAETFLKAAHHGLGVGLSFGGDRACYNASLDHVSVPPVELFKNIEEFYAAELHEFAHSTGHKSRLARGLANTFGSPAYAEEELVAELTAAFLGAEFQIDGRCQHSEYLGHWFKVLQEDKRLFHRAASKAKKATDFLKKAAEKGKKSKDESSIQTLPQPRTPTFPTANAA